MRGNSGTFINPFFNCCPLGILLFKLEPGGSLIFQNANKAANDILNVNCRQLVGKTIEESFPFLSETEVPEKYRDVATEGKIWATERVIYNHGEISGVFKCIAFQTKPKEVACIIEDVDECKHTEKALEVSERKYRDVVENANSIILRWDPTGNVIYMNPYGLEFFGYSKEELVGKNVVGTIVPMTETYTKRDLTLLMKDIQRDPDKYKNNENENMCKDGGRVWISWTNKAIVDERGDIEETLSIGNDITEKKQLEARLLRAQKIEAVGTLAGGIAHDFNNILIAILGNINLALFDEGLKDDTKKLLSDAEQATIRAKGLTQQLLTFSKGGAPVKELSSLYNVIKDSADFVLHGDRVACSYDMHEDLWLVDIDKGQISQVIQNIVLNASHAMPEGGIIKITCENFISSGRDNLPFSKDGRFIKISIRDSGIGMPVNIVDKIFDPYFSTKQEGSGLGLSIVHSIIKKHNGHVSAESTPGVGSTFIIYLPASEKTKTQTKESLTEIKTSTRAKILIMDDEKTVRTLVRKMLVKLGHEVVLATDGEEAVQLYQASISSGKPFELTIMDLTIPGGMGGKEAVQEVLNIDPNAKVIVSSGYSTDSIMANYKEFGFDAAIVKPYSIQALSKVISQLLE